MRYFDYDDNVNFQELHREFIAEFEGNRDPAVLLDIAKHCNTYALYSITLYLQKNKAILENKQKLTDEQKSTLSLINKTQYKITPIFLKKWNEYCPDRRIIFDYIKRVQFDDKQKKLINENFANFHSIGYIKNFLETVDFADRKFIESAIKNGDDYCLKYEYGVQYPKARKEIIASMKLQATKSPHSEIIKQYADELKNMKDLPPQEEARML